MAYVVGYVECSDKLSSAAAVDRQSVAAYFYSKDRALIRARELLEDGYHHTVFVRYGSGEVLSGVRLQREVGFGRVRE